MPSNCEHQAGSETCCGSMQHLGAAGLPDHDGGVVHARAQNKAVWVERCAAVGGLQLVILDLRLTQYISGGTLGLPSMACKDATPLGRPSSRDESGVQQPAQASVC